jgi:drug/metabolite transporter (DMT)-like permease
LKERAGTKAWIAIVIALVAIFLLSYSPSSSSVTSGYLWLFLAFFVFFAWGVQAYVMKFSNETMKAESIFFYMMITGVALIPWAIYMTDFTKPINWGFKGPFLALMIQVLNSIGALTLVYAVRYGKAIVVVPMTSLAPVITILISLIIYSVVPSNVLIAGMVMASVAIYMLAE